MKSVIKNIKSKATDSTKLDLWRFKFINHSIYLKSCSGFTCSNTYGERCWLLVPGKVSSEEITINTYHDHRMAMGLAPLATLTNLKIENPEVVNKSYPGFWDDIKTVGFTISEREG